MSTRCRPRQKMHSRGQRSTGPSSTAKGAKKHGGLVPGVGTLGPLPLELHWGLEVKAGRQMVQSCWKRMGWLCSSFCDFFLCVWFFFFSHQLQFFPQTRVITS